MNINNLIKEAYEIAKSKGWHDEPVSFADYIANIHAEISEAWEEWRNNHDLNEIYAVTNTECITRNIGDIKHRGFKPYGIPIELADVVIRICDMFGEYDKKGFVFKDIIPAIIKTKPIGMISFGEFINLCHKTVAKETFCSLKAIIFKIEEYCKKNHINIEKAIELKMAYNKTRPVRHEGKKV